METIELWPLSQGEIDGSADGFVDALYAAGANFRHTTAESRDGYIERIIRGGFPEAVARPSRRRERFLDNYVADIINRDVMQISEIEKAPVMRAMTRMLAARSGQLLVPAVLAKELGLPQPTVARYLTLLEEVFLIKRLPSWSRRIGGRSIGTSKVAMVDSGVAASLGGMDTHALRQPGRNFGGLMEAFVAMEIARQLTWSQQRAELFHYRTKDKVKVDLVVENRAGQVLAFDVKASSTVRAEDFRGLRHLTDRIGEDLIVGAVLYTGQETVPRHPDQCGLGG
jgi:predicted AAA+ superfamily ATPase